MSSKLNSLPTLEMTIGNQETVVATSDTPAQSASASIVGTNLQEIQSLTSTLDNTGTILDILIPAEVTVAARMRGTILQIVWDLGGGEIENTRVNLRGVIWT